MRRATWEWALDIVATRAVDLDADAPLARAADGRVVALVPGIDMCNHDVGLPDDDTRCEIAIPAGGGGGADGATDGATDDGATLRVAHGTRRRPAARS